MKRAGWLALALTASFSAGWLAGGSGRSAAEVAAGRAEERAAFLEARVLVVGGQLNLLESNFGDAAAQFDAARTVIERLQTRLRETGQPERAGLLEVALAFLREAGDQATALDPGAWSAAEAARHTLESVGDADAGSAGRGLTSTPSP
jgi:hypothetical protein